MEVRIREDCLEDSDVDLIIISDDFEGMKFVERLDLVERVQREEGISLHIEALSCTEKEFEEKVKGSAVLMDATEYWVDVGSLLEDNRRSSSERKLPRNGLSH